MYVKLMYTAKVPMLFCVLPVQVIQQVNGEGSTQPDFFSLGRCTMQTTCCCFQLIRLHLQIVLLFSALNVAAATLAKKCFQLSCFIAILQTKDISWRQNSIGIIKISANIDPFHHSSQWELQMCSLKYEVDLLNNMSRRHTMIIT